jgi:hypothetical protein
VYGDGRAIGLGCRHRSRWVGGEADGGDGGGGCVALHVRRGVSGSGCGADRVGLGWSSDERGHRGRERERERESLIGKREGRPRRK